VKQGREPGPIDFSGGSDPREHVGPALDSGPAPDGIHGHGTDAPTGADPQFTLVRRGFDPDQVRAFLAAERARLQRKEEELREAQTHRLSIAPEEMSERDAYSALAGQVTQLLRTAGIQAQQIRREASEEADRILDEARQGGEAIQREAEAEGDLQRAESEEWLRKARVEAERIRLEAQAEADKVLAQREEVLGIAAAEADRIRREAGGKAEQIRAEADKAARKTRADAERLIASAISRRDLILAELHTIGDAMTMAFKQLEPIVRPRQSEPGNAGSGGDSDTSTGAPAGVLTSRGQAPQDAG